MAGLEKRLLFCSTCVGKRKFVAFSWVLMLLNSATAVFRLLRPVLATVGSMKFQFYAMSVHRAIRSFGFS